MASILNKIVAVAPGRDGMTPILGAALKHGSQAHNRLIHRGRTLARVVGVSAGQTGVRVKFITGPYRGETWTVHHKHVEVAA